MHTYATLLSWGSLALLPFGLLKAQKPQPPASDYTLDGIVRDEGKAPIASAELALMRRGEPARVMRAGTDGRFSFLEVRPGAISLTVRRLGYRPTSLDLDVNAVTVATPMEVELQEIASDIDAVIVEGSKGHLREFYDHKASNNFGKFFERKDIEKRNPAYLSELLRTVAGSSLTASDRSGNLVLLRGCKPTIWVDGMRARGAEMDDVARPADVAGMEVYPSWAGLPAQYQDRDNRMCGVILVWTRNQ